MELRVQKYIDPYNGRKKYNYVEGCIFNKGCKTKLDTCSDCPFFFAICESEFVKGVTVCRCLATWRDVFKLMMNEAKNVKSGEEEDGKYFQLNLFTYQYFK